MNRDKKVNLIIAALVLSVMAHLGAMFWAKPKVMTHIANGIARVVRRAPMRVSEARPKMEPVKIDVLKDEAAAQDAPKAEVARAILPAETTAMPEVEQVKPMAAEMSMADAFKELLTMDAAPKLETVEPSTETLLNVPKMEVDAPSLEGIDASLSLPDMALDSIGAPSFEGPSFDPVGSWGEGGGTVTRMTRTPSTAPKFKPVEQVMAEVDEKIVAQEKEAVKEILESGSAIDMQNAVNVSLASCHENGWTYFRITVSPKSRMPTVSKDLVVLIDASGSIANDRLANCRKHAKEILRTAMNTGDRFNIVAFRDKFSYCFNSWQACDVDSYAKADKWLMKLASHGRTDVFATISSVLTLPRDPKRPIIALVITDGEANSGVSATAQILSKFSALNDGLVSVYMYGVKSSGNRELIDVLTRGNRGESHVFEGWRWNAGDGLTALSERFRDPVLTDLRLAFPTSVGAESYPRLLKNLYRNNTVEIVGRIAGTPNEVALSLRGIAGSTAYDGYFKLPLAKARPDLSIPNAWRIEKEINEKLQ